MSRSKKLRWILTGALLLVATAAGAFVLKGRREVTTSSAEAYRYYKLGRENHEKMYEREAIAAYAEALRHDPHFVMAGMRLAEYVRYRDPERARSIMSCVNRFRDEITPAEELRLRIFEAQLYRKGEEQLDKLVDEFREKFPNEPEAYQIKASRLMRLGKEREGIAEYERLIQVNPNFAIAYNQLGYYWAKQGDLQKAEDNLKRYRFLAADQANPHDSLGELYIQYGRYEEAEESLRKALSIKSDFYPAEGHLGTLEASRGNMLAAADHYRRTGDMAGTTEIKIEFGFNAALALAVAGKADEAKAQMASIEELVKSVAESERKRVTSRLQFNKAALLAYLGDTAEAGAVLASALAGFDGAVPPKKGEKEGIERGTRLANGLIEFRTGRFEQAIADLSATLSKKEVMDESFDYFPSPQMVRIAIAEGLRQLGRTGEAEEMIRPILARNPRFQPAVEEQARLRQARPSKGETPTPG